MTPSDIIAEARILLNDTSSTIGYRYTDASLLGHVNQILKSMALLRPDLFGSVEEITTTAGNPIQALPTTSQRLIDIFRVKDGSAVTEVDREALSRNDPSWMAAEAGTPVHYMRHPRNGNRYFLYPPPVADTILVAEYVKIPDDYEIDDEIVLPPESFKVAIIDGVVFLASSVDDEHVSSGRAKMFLDKFTQQLGVSLESRAVTDTKLAGLKPSPAVAELGEVF